MIFHIPHASTCIPSDIRPSIVLDDSAMAAEVLAMTDHYTDELFGSLAASTDSIVKSDVSRLVVDVERFSEDAQEEMADRGMGVVYTRTSALETLRSPISLSERDLLLDKYYWPHHKLLEDCVKAELDAVGSTFVLGCHSFPSVALPYEDACADPRPDFCLGTDEFHTPLDLVELVEAYFVVAGYQVAIDTPFSGALVPNRYFRTDESVASLMIEVSRNLYMNEGSGQKKSADFKRTQEVIGGAIELIRAYLDNDGDTWQIIRNFGEIVARQSWDSGGPGAGAGNVDLYRFLDRYYSFDDAGAEEYENLNETIRESDVFPKTAATVEIWIAPEIQEYLPDES